EDGSDKMETLFDKRFTSLASLSFSAINASTSADLSFLSFIPILVTPPCIILFLSLLFSFIIITALFVMKLCCPQSLIPIKQVPRIYFLSSIFYIIIQTISNNNVAHLFKLI